MTDFEKIKNALVQGGFRENKHFTTDEWSDCKDIYFCTRGMDESVNFEFDAEGNLSVIE